MKSVTIFETEEELFAFLKTEAAEEDIELEWNIKTGRIGLDSELFKIGCQVNMEEHVKKLFEDIGVPIKIVTQSFTSEHEVYYETVKMIIENMLIINSMKKICSSEYEQIKRKIYGTYQSILTGLY